MNTKSGSFAFPFLKAIERQGGCSEKYTKIKEDKYNGINHKHQRSCINSQLLPVEKQHCSPEESDAFVQR
jgi:hypothetical protein